MNRIQTLKHAGFVLCVTPIVLLWADLTSSVPIWNVVLFFVALPILRTITPWDYQPPDEDHLHPALVQFLLAVPHLAAIMMFATLGWMALTIDLRDRTLLQIIGIYLSAWIAMSLALCVVHDLTHRRSPLAVFLARMLSAAMGYFYFVEEHRVHHGVSGSGHDPETAHPNEGLYGYAASTASTGFKMAIEWESSRLARRAHKWWFNRILWCSAVPIGLCLTHSVNNGWAGAVFYLCLCLGTTFSYRAITFIQHWGLREAPLIFDRVGFAWDSNCVFQCWITLNVAFHEDHHRRPSDFFFKLRCAPHGLRTPFTFPIMFLLTLTPALFKKVMLPRLNTWMDSTQKFSNPLDPNQSEFCVPPIKPRTVISER